MVNNLSSQLSVFAVPIKVQQPMCIVVLVLHALVTVVQIVVCEDHLLGREVVEGCRVRGAAGHAKPCVRVVVVVPVLVYCRGRGGGLVEHRHAGAKGVEPLLSWGCK